jgi:hypothetical protein
VDIGHLQPHAGHDICFNGYDACAVECISAGVNSGEQGVCGECAGGTT